MTEKRYWWLKLPENFFQQKEIKAIRRQKNGDTLAIIYLEMQLASLQNGGVLTFEGFEDSFVEELAYQLEENEDDVRSTIEFLKRHNLLVELSETENQLKSVINSIGSEASSTIRTRKSRKNKKCNGESLQSSASSDEAPLQCNDKSSIRYGDIEKEQELKLELQLKQEKETDAEIISPSISLPALGSPFIIHQKQIERLSRDYPNVDVLGEIEKIRQWLEADPSHLKSGNNMNGFVERWLSSNQYQNKTNEYTTTKPDKQPEELPPGIGSEDELKALKARLRE
ncbi:MAG TPA: phage replisome organizer N-terminal domain-containing protein [Candidatus Gallacutalibacter stercoravium]|nr:phage replisome organizer N-terminal domain-containing protein [Candidatus Gallacutalibacter stercoravium]